MSQKIEGLHRQGSKEPTPPTMEVLEKLKGRDLQITNHEINRTRRGPCTEIGFEPTNPHHSGWFAFDMPWVAELSGTSGWKLERDSNYRVIAVPGSTQMSSNDDGSVDLKLKGPVTFTFLPEGNTIQKPTNTPQ